MTLAEIIQRLKEPVAPSLISQKKVGNSKIDYIAWFDYCDLLDDRIGLGQWQWEIVQIFTSENNKMIEGKLIPDNRLFVTGKLTIFGDDRTISQMATGTEILNCSSYGDPSSNAEAMALRRACAKFGLARYLWDKEEKTTSNNSNNSQSFTPTKPTGKNEITREQWLAMRAKQG
jgi:hypothetical protein